jgi:hypothetical protein
MEKLSIERRVGAFAPGVDYTWTQARHLLGSSRTADAGDWVDVVESNRAADRQRLHAQLRYTWKRQTLAGHYEWVHARDNTDGPFSFPEQSADLGAEWARSAGLAPHTVSAVASFSLPRAISLSVTEMWNSGAPYNVTTGLDAAGDGLRVDRGGRARNSGDGPGFNALSVYGFHRLPLPGPFSRGRLRLHLNLGVQADNVLGNTNYLSVGSIVGASSFGRPLAAMPGRSVRLFLNID